MWYLIHLAHATYFNSQIAYITQIVILLILISVLICLECKKRIKKKTKIIIIPIILVLLIACSLTNGIMVYNNQQHASNYIYQSEIYVGRIEARHHIHKSSNIRADLKQDKKLPHYTKSTKFNLVKWFQYL